MLEKQFVHEMEVRGFRVDCPSGEDLVVLDSNNEQLARVNAFLPFKMNTMNTPSSIVTIVVEFSSTPYQNRF
ncbi:hypothetical protein CVD28_03785 [Bacillus sp. M6-12]|uniref:hypothetical protein n=1 Tax=Bacillus sp. M6-12 TaxID=2054166 RepID=UPI000C777877|nr:hypothetical protein [Bacillus sp. M6-12]PLS19548.1 hypothetical protein CVD28_03785 [Bacillus sp. M6-12]